MKKFFTLFALVLMSRMGAWAQGLTLPTTESKNVYTLSTPRGSLLSDNSKSDKYLCSSRQFTDIAFSETAPDLQFQFLLFPAEGVTNGFYAYSVKTKKFIGANETGTINVTMSDEPVVLYMYSTGQTGTDRSNGETGTWAKTFNSADYPFTISHANNTINQTINVSASANSYGIRNSGANGYDGGNDYRILPADGITVSDNIFNEAKTKIMAGKIAELQTKVDDIVRKSSFSAAGYPVITDDKMVALANYISVPGYPGINVTNYDAALAALNAVYALTDVNLPEEGKAYYIKACFHDATKNKYVSHNASHHLALTADPTTAFVVKKVSDNTFVLVNNDGYYFVTEGNESNKKQALNTYVENKCVLTIAKKANTHGEGVANATAEEVFGCLGIQGRAGEGSLFWLLPTSDGYFYNGNPNDVYYDVNMSGTRYRSAQLRFEEASFPYTTKSLNDGGDGKKYATVALPYAMTIPTGVKAYAATESGDVLTLTDATATSQDVAKGAYILVSESATSAAVLPAAANPAAVENNNLEGSITTVPSGSLYVLNKTAEEGVGFYKFNGDVNTLLGKAYLPSSAAANKLSFRFEDVVTAISAIEGNSKNVEIFDLQGRRLEKAQKGMNIINGHKVLVK